MFKFRMDSYYFRFFIPGPPKRRQNVYDSRRRLV